jgi:hypothetical protein
MLHLHRFEDDEQAPRVEAFAYLCVHGDDAAVHRRCEPTVADVPSALRGRSEERVLEPVACACARKVKDISIECEVHDLFASASVDSRRVPADIKNAG